MFLSQTNREKNKQVFWPAETFKPIADWLTDRLTKGQTELD